MKKFILIAILIIPLFGFTQALSPVLIKGNLTDSVTKEPMPFVHMQLIQNDVIISSTLSDFDGYYTLLIPEFGTYDLRIFSVGYISQLHKDIVFDKDVLYTEVRLNFVLNSVAIEFHEPRCHEHCDCLQESTKKILSELEGKIIDSETGEPLPFANIIVYQGDKQVAGGQSDFDGNYKIKPIPPGTYTVKVSYVGYKPIELVAVSIDSFSTHFVDLRMESMAINMDELIVTMYCCRCFCNMCTGPEPVIEPIEDLFVEQDSINDSITALLPSTLFSSETQVKELSVYPNPTSGEATIANISGVSEITLFDMNGKVMKIIAVTEMIQQSIDLSFYKPGVYVLQYMKDGELKTQRISKL